MPDAPTGTKNNTPSPLATPPQVCKSKIRTNISTAACRIVWTVRTCQPLTHEDNAYEAKTKIKYGGAEE